MTHLTDGQLRAALDDELAASERQHLAACAACQTRRATLAARAARVGDRFARFTSADAPLAARLALNRFTAYRDRRSRKENSMFNKIFGKSLRPVWGLAALVAILMVALSFPGVRAFAGQFLGLFRVQQVTILPIDTTRLGELTGNDALGKQIGQMMSDSMKVTKEPGNPQTAASAAEAGTLAGFTVRVAGSRADAPRITVQDGTAFEFTINRERAQAILEAAGHGDLQLPASLDGAQIAVNIPTGVTLAYGDCPRAEGEDGGLTIARASDGDPVVSQGSAGRRYISCVLLVEIPSPTVNTPPDLDVQKLAEIGLQFTGMDAQEAHDFSQTVDWASTLVIPIPRNGASYEQVLVDGVTGNLIRRPTDDAPEYGLIWVKNGLIYAIGGLGNDWQQALDMANSLR